MTQLVLTRSWREEFERAAAAKRLELLRKDKERDAEHLERERREELRIKEEREDQETRQAIAEAFAPPEHVAAFRVQLDDYSTGTVEALMRNREALDAQRDLIEEMLGQAHVMPDGRRVFRTRDGQRVFDEAGREVGGHEIDPASIHERNPIWEDFAAARREEARLLEEQRQLLEYQQRLDEARARLDRGEITQRELDRMREGLAADMPDAVRQTVGPDGQPQRPGAERRTEAEPVALPGNMDELLRQSGPGPRIAP